MPEKLNADTGFPPEALDPALAAGIDRLTKCVADVEKIRGGLEPLLDRTRQNLAAALEAGMPEPAVVREAERLIEWLEKYARTSLNLAKLVDETARLRSFVAGGADSRPDVGSLSDADLAKIVLSAAEKVKRV